MPGAPGEWGRLSRGSWPRPHPQGPRSRQNHLRHMPRGQAARCRESSDRACPGNEGGGRPRCHAGHVYRGCGPEFASSPSKADACAPPSRPPPRPSSLGDGPCRRAGPSACACDSVLQLGVSSSTRALISQASCGWHAQSHTHAASHRVGTKSHSCPTQSLSSNPFAAYGFSNNTANP